MSKDWNGIADRDTQKPRLKVRAPRGEPCVTITRTGITCNGVRLSEGELGILRQISNRLASWKELE